MDAVLDDARARGRRRRVAGRRARRGCARRTSPARCCASSTQLLAAAAARRARRSRGTSGSSSTSSSGSRSCGSSGPALYQALPEDRRRQLGAVSGSAGPTGSATAIQPNRPMIINQWVPAAHRGDAIGDSARRVRDLLRAHGPRVRHLRADDRRRPARRRAAVRGPGGARAATSRSSTSRCRRR